MNRNHPIWCCDVVILYYQRYLWHVRMAKLLGLCGMLAAVNLRETSAIPLYLGDIPNSNMVLDCNGQAFDAIGHASRLGGGARNPFGQDYERLRNWADICDLDSDGDGMTNGEELGDPLCQWRSAADDGLLMSVVGHPGLNCEKVR